MNIQIIIYYQRKSTCFITRIPHGRCTLYYRQVWILFVVFSGVVFCCNICGILRPLKFESNALQWSSKAIADINISFSLGDTLVIRSPATFSSYAVRRCICYITLCLLSHGSGRIITEIENI
ncbi:hypothetical protein BD410DRAFT_99856 [Rickenella mellea]|uniref:Uncharacterized protein n=1 Tax=Rickenella mellea TaxID=50990 RepID=A0A4Y7PL10_9AGAM|nr:hypothetical protein BD410DRAFT_99856 [Rickenella mellea]